MHRATSCRAAWLAVLLTLGAVLAAAPPAAARVTSNFQLDAPPGGEPTQGELKFGFWRSGGAILSRPIHAEVAVKLDAPVAVEAGHDMIGQPLSAALAAGEVLTGGTDKPGLYCAPTHRGAVCLEDSDGDGRFESARMTQCDFESVGGHKYDLVTWRGYKSQLCANYFIGETQSLPTPIAYSRSDPQNGPSAWATLFLYKIGGGKGEEPLRFELEWRLGDKDGAGFQIPGDPWVAHYQLPPNGVGRIDVNGMVLAFDGFGPNGALRYRVVTPMPRLTLHAWGLLSRGY